VAVYRSPAMSIKLLHQIIDKHLRPVIADSSTPSLVIGDFNVDARQSTVLTDVIQQVNSATHTGGAILDHVYWTGETDRIATEVVGSHWSDHNIVAVRIGDVVATAAQDSSQVNRPPSTSRLFTSASSRARCRRPEQTSTPSKSSTSSAVPSSSSTQSTALQQRTLPRISTTCSFLDGALGPNRSHMEIDLPIEEFFRQYELRVLKARGDGHCLRYSWSKSTELPVNNIKQQILAEYDVNSAMYQDAGVDRRELERYVVDRNHMLNSVDAVLNVLCNAYRVTAFVVGQKYEYRQEGPVPVGNVMEVRRIRCNQGQSTSGRVLLWKTAEHYDSLGWRLHVDITSKHCGKSEWVDMYTLHLYSNNVVTVSTVCLLFWMKNSH